MPPTMRPSVRRVEIPDAAPAYDCETHGGGCPVARDQVTAEPHDAGPGIAHSTEATRQPSIGADRAAGSAGPGASPGGAGTTAAWPRQFAQVMVEILAGVRPQRQIATWTTDRVRTQIRHLGPVLAADRRPRIQRIVTSRPAASVVEMTVVVSFGRRSRALAMRLEYVAARQGAPGLPARSARWLCTELEAG